MANVDLLDITKQYLRALEEGATGERLAAFYTVDAVQEEFPNRLLANGATRDLREVLAGAERGQKLMASQRYELVSGLVQDDHLHFSREHWA